MRLICFRRFGLDGVRSILTVRCAPEKFSVPTNREFLVFGPLAGDGEPDFLACALAGTSDVPGNDFNDAQLHLRGLRDIHRVLSWQRQLNMFGFNFGHESDNGDNNWMCSVLTLGTKVTTTIVMCSVLTLGTKVTTVGDNNNLTENPSWLN